HVTGVQTCALPILPARTPYRRPGGRRRVKTSNRQCRSAVPSASAAWSIVSSYRSVRSAVDADGQYGGRGGEERRAALSAARGATLPGSAMLMRTTVGQRRPPWVLRTARIQW